jgi:O-antigen/teichoic acid export membrane protein
MINSFTKNTLITFTTRVSTLILGMVISIVIARVLGPEGKGVYSLAILLPTLLLTFISLGIYPATIFYIGKKKYPLSEIFGNNVTVTILLGGVAVLIGLFIIFFFGTKLFPGVEKEYLFLALPLVLFTLFFSFISSILVGLEKFKKYNFIYFLQVFIFLILILILLLGLGFKIKATIISYVLSFFLTGIILFIVVKKEIKEINLKLNWRYFRDSFSYGFKVYLGSILDFFQIKINRFLINFFINPAAVGLYSVSAGLAEGLWLLPMATATVLFPRAASEKDETKLKEFTPLVCRNVLFITLASALFLFSISHWLVPFLYSEKFFQSIRPFQILLLGSLAFSGMKILGNDLNARGKPMLLTYGTAVATIFNIALTIWLVPKSGIIGAAWASSISYFIGFSLIIIFYLRISHNNLSEILLLKRSDLSFYKNFFLKIKKLRP